jgi:hypothetical protein
MATTKQKQAARKNLDKTLEAKSAPAQGATRTRRSGALSTAEKDDLSSSEFAFPKERKEPLNDATHVRNAVARFDQVEGVSDAERNDAWKRIKAAARKYDVELEADDWHELFKGGKARKKP